MLHSNSILKRSTPSLEYIERASPKVFNPFQQQYDAQLKMNDSLANCVASLKGSNQSLATSIEIMDSAVSDYPRVQKVLESRRHFELTSSVSIREAQNALVNEIGPEARRLIRITEQIIEKMERKETGLVAKAELQEGRIAGYGRRQQQQYQQQTEAARLKKEKEQQRAREAAQGRANAEKLKQLKAKRERIAYTVERMELQVKQKEREIRLAESG